MMAIAEAIQKDKLGMVLAQMDAATEARDAYIANPTDENLKRAMLAHERAGEETRQFFYLKKSVAEEAVNCRGGQGNRLRMPLRIA
jgi:hypothetical protein